VTSACSISGVTQSRCLWCGQPCRGKTCSHACRQRRYMARKLAVIEDLSDTPKRLAYADPPYPGLSAKYYRDEPTYRGEVDHVRLLDQLVTYDGWALSTSRKALRYVLSLVPSWVEVDVCPWFKTHHEPKSRGPANVHEYVIVVPARRRMPGPRDCLVASAARGGGDLPGRKPLRFVLWLFELLGAAPNDSLDDRYPGTGIVGRCWDEFRSSAPALTPRGDGVGCHSELVVTAGGAS
jgi:hypothetical protein